MNDPRAQELYAGIINAAIAFSGQLPLTVHHPWDENSGYFECGEMANFEESSTHFNPPTGIRDLVQIRRVQYQRLPDGYVRFILYGDDTAPAPEEMRREDAYRFAKPETVTTHTALPKADINPENVAAWKDKLDAFLQSDEMVQRREMALKPDLSAGMLAGKRQELEFVYDFF
ncbi:MAG: hypothetical protein HC912_08940 [Saprospiraceae bacterium]|nr:hypothetical protein [Saprospiraceae bacterium]